MTSSSIKIHDLLAKSETTVGKLIKQAKSIENLKASFSQMLEPELAEHCQMGCYHLGILTIFTDSAAWATRLRYQAPTILSKLRESVQWAGCCSIQVKVETHRHQIKTPEVTAPSHPPLKLPVINAAQLQALIDTLKNQPESERLVHSLERIIQHALNK